MSTDQMRTAATRKVEPREARKMITRIAELLESTTELHEGDFDMELAVALGGTDEDEPTEGETITTQEVETLGRVMTIDEFVAEVVGRLRGVELTHEQARQLRVAIDFSDRLEDR